MCVNGECPKCLRHRPLTKHHVLPRRFFGSPNNAPILLICRMCHTELESYIPEKELQPVQFYWDVLFIHLGKKTVNIVEWSGNRRYRVSRKLEVI